MQSRVPVCQGQGPGLASYAEGQAGGAVDRDARGGPDARAYPPGESQQQPAGDQPGGRALARSASHIYTAEPDTSTVMNADMLGGAGGSQPHGNIQPYLAVNFCIALTGIFPPRN